MANNADRPCRQRTVRWVFNGIALWIATLVSAILVFLHLQAGEDEARWLFALLMFWAIAPPAWFFVEFYALYPTDDDTDFERFKHGQHLAGAVWLGIVAVLVAALSAH